MKLAIEGPGVRAGLGCFWLVGLSVLLTLLLTACGASAPRGGGPTGGATSVTGSTGGGLTIRPCLGSYTGDLNPAVTLTNSSSNVTGNAHTGDIIEIRLDGHHSWSLTGIKPAGALTARSDSGAFDSADGTCVWDFQASAPGNAVITFTGTALCDPTQVCPQYAILQTFTLHIS